MSSTIWNLEAIIKEFLPQSAATLPYLCYFIVMTAFMSMVWILLSFLLIVIRLGLDSNLLKQNIPPRKCATLNVRILNGMANHEIFKSNDTESEQKNESETVDGTEKEKEAGMNYIEDQAQLDTDKDPSEPSNSSAPKPPISKSILKKSTQPEDINMLFNMVTVMQKMFFILIIFLMLAIIIHVTLLMIDKLLQSYAIASVSTEKDKVEDAKNFVKCPDFGYTTTGTNMGKCAFSVDNGKVKGFDSKDAFQDVFDQSYSRHVPSNRMSHPRNPKRAPNMT